MKSIYHCALSLILFLSLPVFAQKDFKVEEVVFLPVQTSINPAVYNYLKTNLLAIEKKENQLPIIKLNTPGGLVTTTKDILTLMGSLKVPVGIWVTPEGASATSAGALIASGAHILLMSPGTNIGAATPITMGSDIKQKDAKAKAVNDLVALVSSLSKARGRETKAFEKMITKAESLDSQNALKEKVIDAIINNNSELLEFLSNREIQVQGKKIKLTVNTKSVSFKTKEMDPGQQILNIFANPTTAYLFFIIGAALLYFELQAPGGFVAGAIGVVFLFLAGIGFQVLPLNVGAMGLIILSFILFVLEAYITSFGVLTIAGVASLIFGSLFLFRTENSLIELERSVVFSVVIAITIYVAFVGWYFIKTYVKPKNRYTHENEYGHVSKSLGQRDEKYLYQVKVDGEIWQALCKEELTLGERVFVERTNEDKLLLDIKKIKKENV